jgi:hypothetical protein
MNERKIILERKKSRPLVTCSKMAERKVVPFDEFYYQLKLMYLFQKHPVYTG